MAYIYHIKEKSCEDALETKLWYKCMSHARTSPPFFLQPHFNFSLTSVQPFYTSDEVNCAPQKYILIKCATVKRPNFRSANFTCSFYKGSYRIQRPLDDVLRRPISSQPAVSLDSQNLLCGVGDDPKQIWAGNRMHEQKPISLISFFLFISQANLYTSWPRSNLVTSDCAMLVFSLLSSLLQIPA